MDRQNRKSASRPRVRLSSSEILISAAVGLCLVLLTYLYVDNRREDTEAHLLSDAESELRYFTAKLETHANARLDVARRMRAAWLMGFVDDEESYSRVAGAEISLFDDLQAINWVNPQGVITWVNPLKGNEAALGLNVLSVDAPSRALEMARAEGRAIMTPPIQLAQGGVGTVVYLPVMPDSGELGFINIAFRYKSLVGGGLTDAGRGDGLRILVDDGTERVFESREPLDSSFVAVSDTIAIANRMWRVTLELREPEFHIESLRQSTLFFIAGSFVSILIGCLVAAVLFSIRSLRVSELRLADFADASSDWFWETDPEGRFTYFSNRFYELTGVDRQDIIGREISDIDNLALTGPSSARLAESMECREGFKNVEWQRLKPDGDTIRLALSGVPAYADDSLFLGYRGVGSDVTERWRFEQRLATALQDAEEANHAKSRFLATLSHELRTPMNAILGFSEFMRAGLFGPINERYRNYANDIHSSGQHLLALIDDLLSYSTMEAGERRFVPERIDVGTEIRETAKNVNAMAAEKALDLTIDLPDTPLVIEADARSVTQIVMNVLTNAVKFTDAGGKVTVKVAPTDDGVEIATTDTGIGIAENQIEKVLEPFAQASGNPTLSKEGTGLGLAIVKGLVEAHRGRLHIESAPGKGTKVTVWLPAVFAGSESLDAAS
ncbi:MAG: ATP-binding protein [Alphaproteobacteria bacterium]|nr:ATP-binding protein [Alphaproteobacteria bacterium]